MNRLSYQPFYRRRLPHIQQDYAVIAITFRLAFTLPNEVLILLRKEKMIYQETINKLEKEEKELYRKSFRKNYYERYDEFLAGIHNDKSYLQNPVFVEIVQDCLHFWHNKRYLLYSYCVMPNHVHLLIEPIKNKDNLVFPISKIMHSIKSYSANKCNGILKENKAFWMHENYDHMVRNENDLMHEFYYILNNPVKAGLTDDYQKWPYTYINQEIFGNDI